MKTWDEIRRIHLPECIYCGEPADTRDHFTEGGKEGPWVFACVYCNSALCDRPFYTVPSRATYIAGRLDERVNYIRNLGGEPNQCLLARAEWARRVSKASAAMHQGFSSPGRRGRRAVLVDSVEPRAPGDPVVVAPSGHETPPSRCPGDGPDDKV